MPLKLNWLNEAILGFVLPKVLDIGGDELKKLLDKAYAENPELIKTTVVSLYPFIDVYVEKYATQSKTKLDDKAVAELMETVEAFAAENEIELPNLDED